ncbi:hypothetical protein PG994_012598 [Apiospora phragmitis]|uniref:Uncharacterized protein n=1 Tax=Apiospora phragmitis TaxID=2905665 RepID=A0ABR1TCQ8_9PEZI
MNPYRGNEYFVVLANAEVHIRASALVETDVVRVLEAYPNMEVISSTPVKRGTTVSTSSGFRSRRGRKSSWRASQTV